MRRSAPKELKRYRTSTVGAFTFLLDDATATKRSFCVFLYIIRTDCVVVPGVKVTGPNLAKDAFSLYFSSFVLSK